MSGGVFIIYKSDNHVICFFYYVIIRNDDIFIIRFSDYDTRTGCFRVLGINLSPVISCVCEILCYRNHRGHYLRDNVCDIGFFSGEYTDNCLAGCIIKRSYGRLVKCQRILFRSTYFLNL